MPIDEYARQVLDIVDAIPRGRVLAYGDIAEIIGYGGPRQVARVMRRHGAEVPWWRVVRADGSSAPEVAEAQVPRLRRERVPFLPNGKIDMAVAAGPARKTTGRTRH